MSDEVDAFASGLSFILDDFQRDACEDLNAGRSVLVAAPTGAGKTIVADFAVYCAVQTPHDKVFYTTPMKALSNQKFQDLVRRHGADAVGLLTGDTVVNPDARIVVMTTEVLRNMLYARSPLLTGLSTVVMDEVHYLADRFRGAVWEEVIVQLPPNVRLIALSATVSNAEEFGAWLQEVRGSTSVIVSEYRPVPLYQHVLVDGGLIDLFASLDPPVVNPYLERMSSLGRRDGGRGGRRRHGPRRVRENRARYVDLLRREGLLPAIVFVFSRAGCDGAVEQVCREDPQLTNAEERRQIREVIERRCAGIPEEDLAALGFWEWRKHLEMGVGSHHAGLLPTFKEVVEELFLRRLVKVVFATETLALGVNMPARSVVIERLDKFNGEQRVPITAGEYTQLTGRAGRRGIDPEGHAVILWGQDIDATQLAALASKRTYPLYSSFSPTYNMSVNLVARVGVDRAREILESSFAQFQADRAVVGLAARVRSLRESAGGYEKAMECSRGDFAEYAKLRRDISDLERGRASNDHLSAREEISRLRVQLRSHPCHGCPDREQHARWARRLERLREDESSITRQIRSRTGAISRRFDRIVGVLTDMGYLAVSSDGDVEVSPSGRVLGRIYGDRDLLLAECLSRGVLDGLGPAVLAALVSVLVHEPRREEQHREIILPRGRFPGAFQRLLSVWGDIDGIERSHGLNGTEPPSAGFALAAQRWASGATLHRVLTDTELSAGDFVRRIRQILDVLDQVVHVADPSVGDVASRAISSLRRGVVEYSMTV